MRTLTAAVFSFLLLSFEIQGQDFRGSPEDSLRRRIIEQILTFPQEKIHVHCDKPVYLAGEKIWFRAYVTDAVLHIPSANQYVIAELINPLDSVVNRIKIRPDSGA
ncbi:MAG TPA: TonB-dependent receptor, partial [Bacteroidales bacterium]|nr:TonB-dependent receptor [Bacteroidales bacterium]